MSLTEQGFAALLLAAGCALATGCSRTHTTQQRATAGQRKGPGSAGIARRVANGGEQAGSALAEKDENEAPQTGPKGISGGHSAPLIEMSNVLFRYSPALTVYVEALRGTLLPTAGHSVPSFNEPDSFVMGTDAAEMRMTTAQLSALMNAWLLRSPKAQLKNVRIEARGGHLLIHGTMKKALHIPFDATAEPGVSGDNRIRFKIGRVTAAHVPLKGMMDALGISMGDLVSQKGLHGISVDKHYTFKSLVALITAILVMLQTLLTPTAKLGTILVQLGVGDSKLKDLTTSTQVMI